MYCLLALSEWECWSVQTKARLVCDVSVRGLPLGESWNGFSVSSVEGDRVRLSALVEMICQ
jgi:hypothetical protein